MKNRRAGALATDEVKQPGNCVTYTDAPLVFEVAGNQISLDKSQKKGR